MAHNYEYAMEHGKFHRRFKGSFAPSGAGISTAAGAVRGTGFTVAHAGATGVYRVTLDEGFRKVITARAAFQSETAYGTPTVCTIGDVNEANRTIDIVVWASGAKADVTASGVLRRINFEIIVAVDDMPGTGATA